MGFRKFGDREEIKVEEQVEPYTIQVTAVEGVRYDEDGRAEIINEDPED